MLDTAFPTMAFVGAVIVILLWIVSRWDVARVAKRDRDIERLKSVIAEGKITNEIRKKVYSNPPANPADAVKRLRDAGLIDK